MYQRYIKRALDFILSSLALVILSPLLLIIAIAVKLDSPGPVIFRQERLGYQGRTFWMKKARTMVVDAEHTGSGVYSGKGDPRVTRVGRILRGLSLDELYQLVNIWKGEMSFVGPRPPLTYHPWPYEQYTAEQKRMFEVRPGITGWAQVHGRRTVEWNHRIELNVWYRDHCSFWLDVKICFMTVLQLFKSEENSNTEATVH